MFAKTGDTDVAGARRLVDRCIEAGINLFDTADVYSWGVSEEILGEVLRGRRDQVLITTKARMKMGDGPNDAGLSRQHLIAACEASLKRLGTDWIDLYQLHEWDGQTPLEETLRALDDLVRSGKVRYVGCSNYSGWQLMKALGVSERQGLERFVSQQIHYTLEAREAEYELVPIAVDQGVGIMVWSPLGRRPADRQVPPRPAAPAGLAPPHRLGRAADPRRGAALRHRRGAGRHRRRARHPAGAGGARLAARPARASARWWSARAPSSS